MIRCPICGKRNNSIHSFCKNCNAKLPNNMWDTKHIITPSSDKKPINPTNNKIKIKVYSIIAIIILGTLLYTFFKDDFSDMINDDYNFFSEEIEVELEYYGRTTNLEGTWDVYLSDDIYSSPDTSIDQKWVFYENNTLCMISENAVDSTPSLGFVSDLTKKTLTIKSINNQIGLKNSFWFSYSIQEENHRIIIIPFDKNYLSIYENFNFKYKLYENNEIILEFPNSYSASQSYDLKLIKTNDISSNSYKNSIKEYIKWSDIEITGNCDSSNLGNYVNVEDEITNCYGKIVLTYKPTNKTIGSFYFDLQIQYESSSKIPPSTVDKSESAPKESTSIPIEVSTPTSASYIKITTPDNGSLLSMPIILESKGSDDIDFVLYRWHYGNSYFGNLNDRADEEPYTCIFNEESIEPGTKVTLYVNAYKNNENGFYRIAKGEEVEITIK